MEGTATVSPPSYTIWPFKPVQPLNKWFSFIYDIQNYDPVH